MSCPLLSGPARRRFILFWIPFLLPALSPGPLFSQGFTPVTQEAGVSYLQQDPIGGPLEVHLQTGGAVAADFDNDGWTDLFVTRFQKADKLFRNLGPDASGQVRFLDVSFAAGFKTATSTNGAVAVDIDKDGDLDLYLSTLYERQFLLYLNQGDGTFLLDNGLRGANLLSNTRHHGFSLSAGDYDRDGWPDLHTTEWSIDLTSDTIDQHGVLLRNFGAILPGWFENATLQAGVKLRGSLQNPTRPILFGFASSFADLDGDGWQDLIVAADFASSQLFWNNGQGAFLEGTAAAGVSLEQNGMGLAIGDFDRDGLLDFFVSSIGDHKLYRNLGGRAFAEESAQRLENVSNWGWGSTFFDYDNDGDLDLVMTTGYQDLYGQFATVTSIAPTRLWRNNGGLFQDVGASLGITDNGPGKGLLTFDYDRDGDLDLFIVNAQSTPILYRNDLGSANDWFRVRLLGRASNRQALGARLTLRSTPDALPQVTAIIGGSNYLGQNELTAHFGLGRHPGQRLHSLHVQWPSGASQEITGLTKNREILLREPLTYSDWALSAFSASTLPASSRLPASDPDQDGLPNLHEYAFATPPLTPNPPPTLASSGPNLPGSSAPALRFRRLAGARDAAVFLESSPDLVSWLPWVPAHEHRIPLPSSEAEEVIFYLDDPGASASTRFFRLAVSPGP